MFFEDKNLIERLDTYFQNNFHNFELRNLFKLMKLQAYSFFKPKNSPNLI
jgi:hypothetical protein